MLLLIHGKSFEFSTWLTREMLIWLENSTQGISNSEDFHYLHWRLVADYPGHVTTHFRTQCQRPVHLKDLICDISHSMKIKYPYTKPQSPTLFISKSHPSHFCTKLWSKTEVGKDKWEWTTLWMRPEIQKNLWVGRKGLLFCMFNVQLTVHNTCDRWCWCVLKLSKINTWQYNASQ